MLQDSQTRAVRLRRRTLQNVDSLDAVDGGRNINLRLEPRLGVIPAGDVLLESVHRSRLDQADRAAAKAPARHACANDARLRGSDLHQEVEFPAAHFVVVAQAAMRLPHQAPENAQVFGVQRADGFLRAVVFSDHMAAAGINGWIQKGTMRFQLRERNVAKRANFGQHLEQDAHAFLTLGAAAIVFTGSNFVFHHRIANHQLDILRELHRFELKRAAIEQERVRSTTVAGDKLIHDANAGTRKFVLGFLAQAGQFRKVTDETALVEERKADSDFDSGRGAEAGAERNVARDEKIRAVKTLPSPSERPSDAERVVAPVAFALGGYEIKAHVHGLVEVFGVDGEFVVVARSGGYPAIELDSRRKNKTIVVVSVLT